jgi:uncharacterized protein YndB with AHSA1/START domain
MSHDLRVMVTVPTDPATTFRVFTEDTDRWWRRGPWFRFTRSPRAVLRFVPGVGGELVEIDPDDEGVGHVVGRIEVWEPGARLGFTWRLPNFAPGELSRVELRFEEIVGGTRVTLTHEGLRALPAGHPARHGEDDRRFTGRVATHWSALLVALRERIAGA